MSGLVCPRCDGDIIVTTKRDGYCATCMRGVQITVTAPPQRVGFFDRSAPYASLVIAIDELSLVHSHTHKRSVELGGPGDAQTSPAPAKHTGGARQ